MPIKQISIFVENKPGRLADITSLVAEKGIDIRALSYGLRFAYCLTMIASGRSPIRRQTFPMARSTQF